MTDYSTVQRAVAYLMKMKPTAYCSTCTRKWHASWTKKFL